MGAETGLASSETLLRAALYTTHLRSEAFKAHCMHNRVMVSIAGCHLGPELRGRGYFCHVGRGWAHLMCSHLGRAGARLMCVCVHSAPGIGTSDVRSQSTPSPVPLFP